MFVAGRVFLQFPQDLLHGRLQTSASSGCVCLGVVRVGRWLFSGYGDGDNMPARPETSAMIYSCGRANGVGPRLNPGGTRKLGCLIRFIRKPAAVSFQGKISKGNKRIIRSNRSWLRRMKRINKRPASMSGMYSPEPDLKSISGDTPDPPGLQVLALSSGSQ